MIPTALAAGLLLGRWWLAPAVGLAWTVAILATIDDTFIALLGAFIFGTVNALAGVALHKLLRRALPTRS